MQNVASGESFKHHQRRANESVQIVQYEDAALHRAPRLLRQWKRDQRQGLGSECCLRLLAPAQVEVLSQLAGDEIVIVVNKVALEEMKCEQRCGPRSRPRRGSRTKFMVNRSTPWCQFLTASTPPVSRGWHRTPTKQSAWPHQSPDAPSKC